MCNASRRLDPIRPHMMRFVAGLLSDRHIEAVVFKSLSVMGDVIDMSSDAENAKNQIFSQIKHKTHFNAIHILYIFHITYQK